MALVNYSVGNIPWSVIAADLDNDGDSDLAVANRLSDNVSILKNNGNGSFNGIDVTYSVGYFKGGPSPIPCPDCPPEGLGEMPMPDGSPIV